MVAKILRDAKQMTQLALSERVAIDLDTSFEHAAGIVSSALARLCENGGARYARRMAHCRRKGPKRTRHWSKLYEHVKIVVD